MNGYTQFKVDNRVVYSCKTERVPRVGELVCFDDGDHENERMYAVISVCHSIGGILHSQDTVVLLREVDNDDNLRYG